MTRIIDDFDAIRASCDELARDQAQEPPTELDVLADADLEFLHAIFDNGHGFELWRVGSRRRVGQEYWTGCFGNKPIGPFPSREIALAYIRQMRALGSR